MTKPFGKPVHHGFGLTRGLRFTIALWGAAVPAYFLCSYGTSAYPTLSESPFFWPAAVGFTILYSVTIALWLRRRPAPRAPGESTTMGLFVARFLLALLVALPAGLISSLLYEPAFKVANALGSPRGSSVEHATLEYTSSGWVLDSPYWEHSFHWKIHDVGSIPKDATRGSLARLTVRHGLLGARWIERIEYTVLR